MNSLLHMKARYVLLLSPALIAFGFWLGYMTPRGGIPLPAEQTEPVQEETTASAPPMRPAATEPTPYRPAPGRLPAATPRVVQAPAPPDVPQTVLVEHEPRLG